MKKNDRRSLISIVLVISIVVGITSLFSFGSVAADIAPTENWGPDADGIFYISSAADLLAFCKEETTYGSYADKTVKLTNDIDCTDLSFAGYGVDTANTRRVLNTFKGTLDGCGYAIKNLTLGVAGNGSVAFAAVLSGGTVKNIKFLNYSSPATNGNISVIAIETEGTCLLENIYTECSAMGSTAESKSVVTAMIGYVGRTNTARTTADVTISNCAASGSLTAYERAAGFVGRAYTGSLVMNDCVWMGSSITANYGQQTASFVGLLDAECTATFNRCLNIGATYPTAGAVMDITSNASWTLNDVYTVLGTDQSSARFAASAAKPTIKITYGGETAYDGASVASDEASAINSAIRTLAVAESRTYTQESFDLVCPTFADNWMVVENQTVKYSSGLTITKILPKTVAAMLGEYSPIDIAGMQKKLIGDSKSMRIVGVVKFEELSEYEEVGFAVTVKKNNEIIVAEKILSDDTVYSSVLAAGDIVTAQELGGKYIYALEIKNFTLDDGYEVSVRAIAKRGDGLVVYCSEKSEFTVNNRLRVIISSDVHYGISKFGESSDDRLQAWVDAIKYEHSLDPIDLLVIAGDLSLDHYLSEGSYLQGTNNSKKFIDNYVSQLPEDIKLFILPGNHDGYNNEQWKEMTGNERQGAVVIDDNLFIMVDNFNDNLEPNFNKNELIKYTLTDTDFINEQMEKYPDHKVWLIGHYFDPANETREFKRIVNDPRVKGLFAGHNHRSSFLDMGAEYSNKKLAYTGQFSYTEYYAYPAMSGNNIATQAANIKADFWGFRELVINDESAYSEYIIAKQSVGATFKGYNLDTERSKKHRIDY